LSKIKSFFGGLFSKKLAVTEAYVEKVDEALEDVRPPQIVPDVDIMRQPVTQSRPTLFPAIN